VAPELLREFVTTSEEERLRLAAETFRSSGRLERAPKKCEAVFGKEHAQSKM